MIEFLSNWAKSLGLAIIVISILEMILPNNKTKKYVRMIFGIYIIFNIIAPFVKNKDILDVSAYSVNEYNDNYTINENILSNDVSANNKIEQIYVEELEKDISNKLNELGYLVKTCNVYAKLSEKKEDNYIEKIVLKVEKDNTKEMEDNNTKNETVENQLVEKIQKIKPINTNINQEENNEENSISNGDYLKIKKFMVEEYGVDEKCLKIN